MLHNQLPLPVEIIFSCAVCQATIAEIYKTPEGDKGFRDGGHTGTEGPVTKLWLTECAHLTCGKHLEGGGAPFHRPNEQPQAPCPICSVEQNDHGKKALYGIRGYLDGSFDPKIPKNWFDTPPIKLDGSGKGMDALRFHYLALVRFGTNMLVKLQTVKTEVEDLRKASLNEISARQSCQNEVETLKGRITELQKCEKELQPWKERESKIKYYLGIFSEITRENEKLREQLSAMGYAVPVRRYSFEQAMDGKQLDHSKVTPQKPAQEQANDILEEMQERRGLTADLCTGEQGGSSSSRTLSGTVLPQETVSNLHTERTSNSSNKRKLNQAGDDVVQPLSKSPRNVDAKSRSLMPPPPLPSGRSPVRKEQHSVSRHHPRETPSPARRISNQLPRSVDDNDLQTLVVGARPKVDQSRHQLHPELSPRNRQPRPSHVERTLQAETEPEIDNQQFENHQQMRSWASYEPNQNVLDGPSLYDEEIVLAGQAHEPEHFQGIHAPQKVHNQWEEQNHTLWIPNHEDERRQVYNDLGAASSRSRQMLPLQAYSDTAQNRAWSISQRVPFHANDFDRDLGLRQHVLGSSSPDRNGQLFRSSSSPRKQPGITSVRKESVISPFFRRTGAVEHSGRLSLPQRQAQDARPSNTVRNLMDHYRMPPPPQQAKAATSNYRNLNSLSFMTKPHNATTHRPIYSSLGQQAASGSSRRASSTAIYEPLHAPLARSALRNSQGLFERPTTLTEPVARSFSRTQQADPQFIAPRPNLFSQPIVPNRSQLRSTANQQSHNRYPNTLNGSAASKIGSGVGGSIYSASQTLRDQRTDTLHQQFGDIVPEHGNMGQRSIYSSSGGRRMVRR